MYVQSLGIMNKGYGHRLRDHTDQEPILRLQNLQLQR
jgi:hypothetical protein